MTDKQKKKYTSECIRVDKEICNKVRDQLVGKETIGGFYDRAAVEKLAIEEKPFPIKKETKGR